MATALRLVSLVNHRKTAHLVVLPVNEAVTTLCGTDDHPGQMRPEGAEWWLTAVGGHCCGHCERILGQLNRQIVIEVA